MVEVPLYGTIFEMQFLGLRNDQRVYNFLHWSNFDDNEGGNQQIIGEDVFDALLAKFKNSLMQEMSPTYTLHTVQFYCYDSWLCLQNKGEVSRLYSYSKIIYDGTTGGRVGLDTPMPTFTCASVSKRCAIPSKYNRGNFRWDCLDETDHADNKIDEVRLPQLQTTVDDFHNPVVVPDWNSTPQNLYPIVQTYTKHWEQATPREKVGHLECDKVQNFIVNEYVSSQISRKQTSVRV